jgi:hemerythrin-like metal-binding protein
MPLLSRTSASCCAWVRQHFRAAGTLNLFPYCFLFCPPIFQFMSDSATLKPINLGYEKLDRDHAILFELMDELRGAIDAGTPREGIDRIMLSLRAFFDAHRDNEEELMEQSNYPAAAPHILEHRKIGDRMEHLSQRVALGDPTAAVESLCVLQDWIANHIARTDLDLALHLRRVSTP